MGEMRSITVEIAFTEKPNREKGSFIQTRKAVGVCTLHRPTPTAYPDYIYTHTNTPFSVFITVCAFVPPILEQYYGVQY